MRSALFFLMTVLAACEMIVDVDIPIEPPRLTVNSLTDSDSTWTVDITRSKFILEPENGFDAVDNAVVTITDETLHNAFNLPFKRYGRYAFNQKPVPGHTYTLNVKVDGYEDVTATTLVPELVKIKSTRWDSTDIAYDDLNFQKSIALYVTFDDPPGVRNNYEIAMYGYYTHSSRDQQGNLVQTDSSFSYIQIFHADPTVAGIKSDDGVLYHQFNDLPFDGEEKTIKFHVPAQLYFAYHVVLRLGNQTGDYARYEDTRWLQFQAQGDPFAQPAPVHTNVQNGYGIFAGRTWDQVEWDVPKSVP